MSLWGWQRESKYEEPRYTCPIVDECKSELENLEEEITANIKTILRLDLPDEIIEKLEDGIEDALALNREQFYQFGYKLEDVRDSNRNLRDWGQECKKKAEEFEADCDSKDKELDQKDQYIAKLEEEGSNLADRIEELEEELRELRKVQLVTQ